jgi:hypothetical protein
MGTVLLLQNEAGEPSPCFIYFVVKIVITF